MKISQRVAAWIGLAVLASPALAVPDMYGRSTQTFTETVRSGYFSGSHETPTLQRQRIERLTALREEANRLQAADGGTLSAQNVRYIRRQAETILRGSSRGSFGSHY